MEKKTIMIIVVAVIVIAAAGCAGYFLLKDNGKKPDAPTYEGEWATKTIHDSYFDNGSAKYEEIPVESAKNINISKEGDFYKLSDGENSYYAVQKGNGLLSVSTGSGDTDIVSIYAEGNEMTMSIMNLDTQHVLSVVLNRVVLTNSDATLSDNDSPWNPAEGDTVVAYQKTRYVDDVPIDYNDRNYVLTIDMVTPHTIMYHQTITYFDPDMDDKVIYGTAARFSWDTWIAIGPIDEGTLIDYITVQNGNLYFFSAYDYEGTFSIWDVRYGDKTKNIDNKLDAEGHVFYGMEKNLSINKSGKATLGSRSVMLYCDKSFGDHQLMDLNYNNSQGTDVYGMSMYDSRGKLTTYAQGFMSYSGKMYEALIFGSYDSKDLTICGICLREDGAALFIQDYGDEYRNKYPVVEDIKSDDNSYRYFDIRNADSPKEGSVLGWGVATYNHTEMISSEITWDEKFLAVDHDKKTIELRGNYLAYLYDVTLKFSNVDDIDAVVTDKVLTISFDGIKKGFGIEIDFQPVDRLTKEWVLAETYRGSWMEGIPLIETSYETGTLTITQSGDWYTISDGTTEVLGTGNLNRIATAGLFDGASTTYILTNIRSEFMRVVYFEDGDAVVKIYAPKGYIGTYNGVEMVCDLPDVGETIQAYKVTMYNPDPVDYTGFNNTFEMANVDDGMIFYKVDADDIGTIYSIGLYMNGSDFFSYCDDGEHQYMEMISFYDGYIYSQSTLPDLSTWATDFGDESKATHPYQFFGNKTYEGKENNIIYKDGAVVQKYENVNVILKSTDQYDEYLRISTVTDNDDQGSWWGMKIGIKDVMGSYSLMNISQLTYKDVYYEGTYYGVISEDLSKLVIIGNLVGEDGSVVVIKQTYQLAR